MTATSDRPGIDSPELARKMWRTLEPYHGIVYFTPHAEEQYGALGHPRSGRLLRLPGGAARPGQRRGGDRHLLQLPSRSRPPRHPRRSGTGRSRRRSWPRALRAADLALREILGDEVTGDDVVEAAELAGRAARVGRARGSAALRRPRRPRVARPPAPLAVARDHASCGSTAATATSPHSSPPGLDPLRGAHHPRRGQRRRGMGCRCCSARGPGPTTSGGPRRSGSGPGASSTATA